MSNKGSKWLVGLGAPLLAATLAWWWFREAPANNRRTNANSTQPSPVKAEARNPLARLLPSAADDLVAAQTRDDKRRILDRLRVALADGATNGLVTAIREFLDTRTDASTGQGFKIGANGSLLEAPTLRTFLLDQLARLDPPAAAAYARVILETSTSPDEWAIALRDLARGDMSPEARALLEAKTGELLQNESWQRDPSEGYLEAFDTAVALGSTNLLPPLSNLICKKDNQPVAHAAYLTLDRLVLQQPAQILAALLEHPEWMQGRDETRANFFARADVADAGQRSLVESYLLWASRSPAELEAFAGVYPNANFMISQNLLTGNMTPDGAALRQRDSAALAVVNQWLADPRFAAIRQPLTKIQQRLEDFARQAANNR